jgi:hypothetical protein
MDALMRLGRPLHLPPFEITIGGATRHVEVRLERVPFEDTHRQVIAFYEVDGKDPLLIIPRTQARYLGDWLAYLTKSERNRLQ